MIPPDLNWEAIPANAESGEAEAQLSDIGEAGPIFDQPDTAEHSLSDFDTAEWLMSGYDSPENGLNYDKGDSSIDLMQEHDDAVDEEDARPDDQEEDMSITSNFSGMFPITKEGIRASSSTCRISISFVP